MLLLFVRLLSVVDGYRNVWKNSILLKRKKFLNIRNWKWDLFEKKKKVDAQLSQVYNLKENLKKTVPPVEG